MDKFDNGFHISSNPPYLVQALIFLVIVLVGFFVVGPLIGLVLGFPFYDGGIMEYLEAFTSASGNNKIKIPFYIVQGFTTAVSMILIPLMYLKISAKKNPNIFFKNPLSVVLIFLTLIITITFMSVNSVFIEWNASISFPDFMSGFEDWARATEDRAAELTKFLTTFDSVGQFIFAFIIIAILAGVGEELVFRGFLQNQFHKAFDNIHLAIWVSAFLFSAIHMQFFGFIPRMLLGALFGYLYHWSGNLAIPMISHAVNNGFTLVLVYLNQIGTIDFDMENSEAAPLSTVFIFAIITGALMFFFRKQALNAHATHD